MTSAGKEELGGADGKHRVREGHRVTESMVEVLPVDSLDEVLQHALVGAEEKVSLVERLANVIDTISSGPDTQPSA